MWDRAREMSKQREEYSRQGRGEGGKEEKGEKRKRMLEEYLNDCENISLSGA